MNRMKEVFLHRSILGHVILLPGLSKSLRVFSVFSLQDQGPGYCQQVDLTRFWCWLKFWRQPSWHISSNPSSVLQHWHHVATHWTAPLFMHHLSFLSSFLFIFLRHNFPSVLLILPPLLHFQFFPGFVPLVLPLGLVKCAQVGGRREETLLEFGLHFSFFFYYLLILALFIWFNMFHPAITDMHTLR